MNLIISHVSVNKLDDYTAPVFFTCLREHSQVDWLQVDESGNCATVIRPDRRAQVIALLSEFDMEWSEVDGFIFVERRGTHLN